MSQKKITIGTVCFLFDKNRREVLLLERAFQPMQGMLTGVGGKTNFDEGVKQSCIREVKEETGFDIQDLKLNGILKTVAVDKCSSWILFVYSSNIIKFTQINCPEGKLNWVNQEAALQLNLIGFIKEIYPFVLSDNQTFEGTIVHDKNGKVLEKQIDFRTCEM